MQAKSAQNVEKAIGDALTRIRDDWAANVHVDTGFMKAQIEGAHITFQSATSGSVTPAEIRDYFYYQEYGTVRLSANPAMRQAVAKEAATLQSSIGKAIQDAINGTG
jgi:hypothetical protein